MMNHMYNFLTPEEYLSGDWTYYRAKPYATPGWDEYVRRQKVAGKPLKSKEAYVLTWIQFHYEAATALIDYDPTKKRSWWRSLFDTTAHAGMYSANDQIARGSIVRVAQIELERQRTMMTVRARLEQLDREYQYVMALTEDYFHGEERRQQAERAEQARMRLQAQMIAYELAREAQRASTQ